MSHLTSHYRFGMSRLPTFLHIVVTPMYQNLPLYDFTNAYIIIRGSIVASISACHAEDPGSIPGLGVFVLHGWYIYMRKL